MENENEFMDFLKFARDFYIGSFKSMLPWTPWQVNDHINYLTELKDFYQPKIEEKTGVNLKDVEVKRYSRRIDDVYYDQINEILNKMKSHNYSLEIMKSPTEIFNIKRFFSEKNPNSLNAFNLAFIIGFPFFKTIVELQNQLHSGAVYSNSSIYIPTGWSHRVAHYVFKEPWDSVMIHELSHCLWDKISNTNCHNELVERKGKDEEIFKEWAEGFASYCEHNYFFDLYKDKIKEMEDKDLSSKELESFTKKISLKNSNFQSGRYSKGRKRIEKVVENYGLEAVLEVPKKWQEFEKELFN